MFKWENSLNNRSMPSELSQALWPDSMGHPQVSGLASLRPHPDEQAKRAKQRTKKPALSELKLVNLFGKVEESGDISSIIRSTNTQKSVTC